MTKTPEQKLAALFAEQAPPARDPVFTVAVMERAARRRAIRRMTSATPWAVAAGVVLWGVQPVLEPVLESVLAAIGPVLAPSVAILAATLVLLAGGQMMARRFGGSLRR